MSDANDRRWTGALARMDVNLLVALDALLQEANVTRAAGRIGVTQSAMSQTLARLRRQFDDPILAKSGRHMVIAIFYTEGIDFAGLIPLVGGLLLYLGLIRIGVRPGFIYTVPLIVMWAAMHQLGVHATMAGVIAGLLIPVKPWLSREQFLDVATKSIEEFQSQTRGNYDAEDVMHPKQLGKRPVRRVRFGERQQATGLQIQPMDHHHGGLVTSARQKIGKIVSIAFGGGRREQPRRLKGDHQVRVFENHPMGRQFALDAGSRLLAGSPTGAVERPPQVRHDSLARTDLAARDFNPRAIDEDATDVEQNSGLATRKLWHMFSVYVFLTVIGALCSLEALANIGELGVRLAILAFTAVAVHGAVVFGGARLLKVDPVTASVASQANVGGGTTALALARSLGRPDLAVPGILVGSLGTAAGTFLGFWLASAL